MLAQATQQLILKLWELTRAGAIHWDPVQSGGYGFSTEGYQVHIQGSPSRFQIIREDNKVIEEANARELSAATWPYRHLATYEEAVLEMTNGAQSAATERPQTANGYQALPDIDTDQTADTPPLPQTSPRAAFTHQHRQSSSKKRRLGGWRTNPTPPTTLQAYAAPARKPPESQKPPTKMFGKIDAFNLDNTGSARRHTTNHAATKPSKPTTNDTAGKPNPYSPLIVKT